MRIKNLSCTVVQADGSEMEVIVPLIDRGHVTFTQDQPERYYDGFSMATRPVTDLEIEIKGLVVPADKATGTLYQVSPPAPEDTGYPWRWALHTCGARHSLAEDCPLTLAKEGSRVVTHFSYRGRTHVMNSTRCDTCSMPYSDHDHKNYGGGGMPACPPMKDPSFFAAGPHLYEIHPGTLCKHCGKSWLEHNLSKKKNAMPKCP